MDATGKKIIPYVMIFFAIVILYKVISLSFSLVIWVFIGLVVARYFYLRQEKTSENTLVREKYRRVPTFRTDIPNRFYAYADIIDFLYGINYYYGVNPNAYENLVDSINTFLQLYEQIMHRQMIYCKSNAEVASGFVTQARNNLLSMIYGLSPVELANKKFHTELDRFGRLMSKYLDQIIVKCNEGIPDPIDLAVPKAVNYAWVPGTVVSTPTVGSVNGSASAPTSFEYY